MDDRKKLRKELDDIWREIIYLTYNYTCEICWEELTPVTCNAHHIIGRGNFNVRWDKDNGSLLCYYDHNIAKNAPHYDNEKYLIWLREHRPEGFYENLLRKSGEMGGANKCEISVLTQKKEQMQLELQSLRKLQISMKK